MCIFCKETTSKCSTLKVIIRYLYLIIRIVTSHTQIQRSGEVKAINMASSSATKIGILIFVIVVSIALAVGLSLNFLYPGEDDDETTAVLRNNDTLADCHPDPNATQSRCEAREYEITLKMFNIV